jgi:UDP-glucose 4-epimerase
MVRYLLENSDHGVVVLDNLAKGHREAVRGVELVVGDFGSRELVTTLCRERAIDAVIHFGADSLVGESMEHPEKYFTNNVVKGKHLLDGAMDAGVGLFVFSSTAAVYGDPVRQPIREDDPKAPLNPYGRTKLAFEYLLESYSDAYGLRHSALRYFNACGAHPSGEIGEDHAPETHLIPLVLQVAMGTRKEIAVFGDQYATPDGTCIRDYIHVQDLAAAHLLALERLADGGASGAYNLGNGTGFSVHEIIEVCRAVTGHPIPARVAEPRQGDPAVLVASAERAVTELGWSPRYTDVRDIVATAWQWHQSHPLGYVVSE